MFGSSWGITLKNYWYNGWETPWSFYVPLMMLAVFAGLSIVVNIIRTKTDRPAVGKAWSSVYLAGLLTNGVAVLTALCLMRFSSFFANQVCQLGFLVGLILMGVVTILAFAKLCTLGKQKDRHALGLAVTEAEQGVRFIRFKRYSWVLWLWSLTLAIPFAVFLIPNQSKHLISVVLDNSGSMDGYLTQCTQALEAALLPTQQSADYVFTTIDYVKADALMQEALKALEDQVESGKIQSQSEAWRKLVSQYYDDLVKQKSSLKTSTNTEVYNDVQTLFNAFAQMAMSEDGSPVYEGIWQNYLISRDLSKTNAYVSKKMIVITDGMDNVYFWLSEAKVKNLLLGKDIFQEVGHLGQSADEFYDAICTINYGEYAEEFLFQDCAGSIDETYDGTDGQSYFDAFRSILPEMYFDKLFLYILIGLSCLQALILLIVKTSKI